MSLDALKSAIQTDHSANVRDFFYVQAIANKEDRISKDEIEDCFMEAIEKGHPQVIYSFLAYDKVNRVLSRHVKGDALFSLAAKSNGSLKLLKMLLEFNKDCEEKYKLRDADLGWALSIAIEKNHMENFRMLVADTWCLISPEEKSNADRLSQQKFDEKVVEKYYSLVFSEMVNDSPEKLEKIQRPLSASAELRKNALRSSSGGL